MPKFVKEPILLQNLTKISKIINRKNDTLHNAVKYDKKRMAYAIRFSLSKKTVSAKAEAVFSYLYRKFFC